MSVIRTVTGDIAPDELGVCLPHEHLLGAPPDPFAEQDSDLILDSEIAAQKSLGELREAGGNALVEMTPIDYNRYPSALRRISAATGVHVICVTGFLKEKFCGRMIEKESVDSLAELFIHEIEKGIDDTGVHAGVIKASSSLNSIRPNEEKVFRAAAIAHKATGALISTHTEMGTMALEQAELLIAEGVAPNRILIGHLDHKLQSEYHLALAQKGVYLGIDQIGKFKYASDETRAQFVSLLVRAGYAPQLMLSGDLARKSYFPAYGGTPGFAYVLREFLPMLRSAGVDDATLHMITVQNPAHALTLAN